MSDSREARAQRRQLSQRKEANRRGNRESRKVRLSHANIAENYLQAMEEEFHASHVEPRDPGAGDIGAGQYEKYEPSIKEELLQRIEGCSMLAQEALESGNLERYWHYTELEISFKAEYTKAEYIQLYRR
jgi:hypothetical protein